MISNLNIPVYKYPDWPWGKRGKGWAIVCRYGAYGDHIVSSAVLPYVKREGYKVIYNTTHYGMEVILHNPLIDEIWYQEQDLVPAKDLDIHWDKMKAEVERFIQLNQSVEVECVAVQYRDAYAFNDKFGFMRDLRRKKFGHKNFYENTIEKAGYTPVPPCNGNLWFSDFEIKQAKDYLRKHCPGKFIVIWSLSGSGLNKGYPWFEYVAIPFLRKCRNAVIITVGDDVCRLIEIEKHPRVLRRSGWTTMRQNLALVPLADLIVGLDTGMLHAAGCFDEVYKIALLSVNTEENVTKHFRNCINLAAYDVPCYPCHTLIYNREGICKIGNTGASLCLEKIRPETVMKEMVELYDAWNQRHRGSEQEGRRGYGESQISRGQV